MKLLLISAALLALGTQARVMPHNLADMSIGRSDMIQIKDEQAGEISAQSFVRRAVQGLEGATTKGTNFLHNLLSSAPLPAGDKAAVQDLFAQKVEQHNAKLGAESARLQQDQLQQKDGQEQQQQQQQKQQMMMMTTENDGSQMGEPVLESHDSEVEIPARQQLVKRVELQAGEAQRSDQGQREQEREGVQRGQQDQQSQKKIEWWSDERELRDQQGKILADGPRARD